MKKVLLGLSVIALGFVFAKDYTVEASPMDAAPPTEAVARAEDEPSEPSGKTTDVATVVQKALAFKAMLTSTQQGTLEQTYTPTLARRWSNLPVGNNSPRNGIRFDALTTVQLASAYEVVQAAAGIASNEGYDEFLQILSADSFLSQNGGGNQYGDGLYFLAFLNTPSTTGAWMLQFGGHHYAANIAFNGGQVVGATPWHTAVEPLSILTAGGTKTPLYQERDALIAMWNSLSSTQITSAQLSGNFGDIQLGASSSLTTTFPSPSGLQCNTLTAAQKALVLDVISKWVTDVDTATANALMAIYTAEIDSTFISWASGRTYTATGNYARIDGPSVWIELATQGGVVLPGVHYHTIWRDQKRDYGNELTATSLGGTTSVAGVATLVDVTAYPNPATDRVHIVFPTLLSSANVQVVNVASGQTMQMLMGRRGPVVELNSERLAPGYYVVRINDGGKEYVGKFSKR